MKIELELLILLAIAIPMIASSLYFVSPNVDNYWHFSIAKFIAKDPTVLLRTTYSVPERRFIVGETIPKGILSYPMLMHIMLVPFVVVGAEKLFWMLLFAASMLLMWKWEKRAIPFLFLSWIFIRISIFGGIDLPMMVMAIACIYFFEKNPLVSGIFAGLSPLIKGIGLMVLLGYVLAIFIFKHKELKNRRIIYGLVISVLIASTWYARNLVYLDWNIMEALTGNIISKTELFQRTGFQAVGPERELWDTTGYYPLPIDILLYVGTAFTIYNICKNRKFAPDHIFITIALAAYFIIHMIDISFMSGTRLYLFIFPFLAVQISRSLNDQRIKYAYVICLIFFLFFMLNIPKYAWNGLSSQMSDICEVTKRTIGNDTVYVKAFQDLFAIWRCGLTYQAAFENESIWTLDLYVGKIYETER